MTHRIAWAAHDEELPILEGTVIRLQVERLPSGAIPKPVWLWHSRTGLTCTQLRLARELATDLRRPWEKPRPTQRLSPSRIRRGFRNLRPQLACPACVPKPSRPGPGRPTGLPNHQPAARHDVHTVTSTNKQKPTRGKKTKSTTPRPRRTG
ncbi:hypothetical protein [Saccharothrix coeruleofusca]|uniref:Uncharacterized protein n=1 Tax=Saccharothrix coeruleofusca TaxID=33919 RepID=A0A918AMP9_9PSEU|nr:hypothetical protein [Saccharothrix coeruleofusca]GGP52876.1 hypothetical protein GCM10010185_26240 [Saccharothrix coeruleofusca]